jgi:hypothetical protein
LHLSVFFGGVQGQWENVLNDVGAMLKGEDLENPYGNEQVWEKMQTVYSLDLKDNRMFRNRLKKAGIPLSKSRKDIYCMTKKWKEQKCVMKVARTNIPQIRLELQEALKLFGSRQTKQCKEKQFTPFVEDRIGAVLKKLGVEVVPAQVRSEPTVAAKQGKACNP